MKPLNEITGVIVDCAMKIHTDLGPGLLESVYEISLARALEDRGIQAVRQKAISFQYNGVVFDEGFRADLVVENQVIVEIKSIDKLAPIHSKQLLSYLRLSKMQVGLLINFGALHLRDGLQRVVNNLREAT